MAILSALAEHMNCNLEEAWLSGTFRGNLEEAGLLADYVRGYLEEAWLSRTRELHLLVAWLISTYEWQS